jgi:hypothetical protein
MIKISLHKNHKTPVRCLKPILKSCITSSNITKIHSFPQSFSLFSCDSRYGWRLFPSKVWSDWWFIMMIESVSVSQEMGFMCVKWKLVVNSNNAFHFKINHICWHSALVHNLRHKCADKYDFNDSTTGLEKEKWLCYTNELLVSRFMTRFTP